jgi:hypothetical protein
MWQVKVEDDQRGADKPGGLKGMARRNYTDHTASLLKK